MTTFPLSQTQLGIYTTCLSTTEEGNYNIPFLYKLDSDIDLERLAKAVDAVIAAHPCLKARLITNAAGEVVFEDRSSDDYKTPIVSINDIEEVKGHLSDAFELLNSPLFCTTIYSTLSGNYYFQNFHHIIYDGLSHEVFRRDLTRAYAGENLSAEAVDGRAVAEKEEELRQSSLMDEERAVAVEEFGAASELESIPLGDVYGNKDERFEIKEHTFTLDKKLLQSLADEAGVSSSIIFTAAFGYALSRYSGEEQALYTTVYHGRNDRRTRQSCVMMVKTFPVYNDFKATTDVVSLLQQTSKQIAKMRSLQCYSFADMSSDLNIKSDVNFAYQGKILDLDITLDGRKQPAEDLRQHTPGIKFNAQLAIRGEEYVLIVEYPTNRYSKQFIDTFCIVYENVLNGMLRVEKLSEIALCNAAQLAELDSFNEKETVPSVTDETIVSLFRQTACAYPHNVAAIYKDKSYTYQELDEITDRLASHIRTLVSEGKEPVVSVLIPRCEYIFIASLAALKAGCAYQPLDPSYPADRLNFMVADSGAELLIADESLRDIIQDYKGAVLLTKDIPEIIRNTEVNLAGCAPTPHTLFTLLYTSGSTGVPKGVMLEHHNLVAFCRWYHHHFELEPDSNVAAYASYGFDANMMDLYPAFTRGATVHIIPEEIRLDLVAINDYFEKNNISHCLMTTQVGVQFLLNMDCRSLKHLMVGGEKLVSVDPPTHYKLHNCYGPTECTIITTTKPVEKKEENIPIGRPVDELNCYVVDKEMRRLPVGAVGELVICGNQVARGYLNRPEKTAEAFFEIDGQPAYHSGDIVRYRTDGDVEFVGRKDGQVKIRGFRIELKEVESVIREYPAISDVTVQAYDDGNGGKFIAAFIVSDEQVEIESLNSFIAEQKPPYMVPAVTMQIEKIPLNVNQKVDKKALPKPELQSKVAHSENAAPLNRLEVELKDIIASVIKTEEFGITEPLGYWGLTSISSIRLATLLYKRFGVQVDNKRLTVGSLQDVENQILEHLLCGECAESPAVERAVVADRIGLTYPQLGVYFDCVKNPESVMYNVPYMYTFSKSVTVEALLDAVRKTAENHQSLKLTFGTADGEPVQILNPDMQVEIPVKQMSDEELERYSHNFVRSFNLQKGPLFRFEVVETESGISLLIDIHHLVTDGGSLDLLMREITDRLNGKEVEEERYSYLQFAADQKAAEDGEEFRAAKAFFDERLRDCEGGSEITADLKKKDNAISSLGRVSKGVDPKYAEELAKKLGVTPAAVYLAATFYTLSRYVNNKHLYIGTISNGRGNLKVYNTTGMFVNTLALSSEIGEESVEAFISATARGFSEALSHESYPFARIAADFGFRPEVVFEYQVGVLADYKVGGEALKSHPLQLDLAKFKVKVAIFDEPDGSYRVEIGYDESLYSKELMYGLAESVAAVVEHFAEAPESQVKRISIMSAEQRECVEKMYNVARAEVPYKRFYEPIERNAVLIPDHTALIACDRTLSFKQLNAESNRIAHALMARGVKHGDRVVLLLPRTSAVICCIYGVSKAGAAYIPCDPEYPADRISLITEDSDAAYVVTTEEHMAEHGAKAINVKDLLAYEGSLENPGVEVSPDDLVYLIYTSGSTGRPKGVMLRHEAICSYLYDHPANIHIHSLKTDNVKAFLSITTLSFDMSLKEYASALQNGVTLVLANEDEVNNPMLLAELFARTGAEAINGTPSRLLNYMELPAFCDAIAKCKMVWSGGEKYSDKLLSRLHDMGVRIFNTYGPTEITVSSNGCELTHQERVTVGRPLLNYTEFIVDADGNELPVGVVGELYIGGMGVAKGYNNLPEQTAERFVDYKPQSMSAVRVYKSGDYARWLSNGQVDILGRTDNQVKLRGLRIELGEVEAAISKVAGIKQAVVMIRTISGKEHLSAYFTAEQEMDIEEMKSIIGETLTPYMVPTAWLQLASFPLTPNGKTDLKHLPEPVIAQLNSEYVAPKNSTESDFCDIFAQILELDKVSAADSFFDLGGTSLTVTRVIIEAANRGYTLAYAEVFKNPTPQKLALLLTGGEEDDMSDPEVTDYDYTKINEVLAANNLENFKKGTPLKLGNVLLTGANGYLGIHVLHELLEERNSDRQIYCLVRHGREGMSSEARLKNLLFYYFEDNYSDQFGTRVHVIDGDVTNPKAFESVGEVDTVINCAAIVKHFSDGTEIEDINIGGLQNCVDFCLQRGAQMIQTSTFSISGQSVNGVPDPHINYGEQMLYFGQLLSSKYTHSKFLAERILLEAVAEKGLVGKIMRLGNLAPRAKDGEFQINFGSNSAMGRLHIYQMLGVCGYSQAMSRMEFSPIDEVAHAVLLLARTPKECVVFHPFNNHMQLLGDVIREMADTLKCEVKEVEEEEFQEELQKAGQDPEKARILQSMLAYKASGKDTILGFEKFNPYTCNVLARLGFHWHTTSWDYVSRFVESIASLDFFEDKRW